MYKFLWLIIFGTANNNAVQSIEVLYTLVSDKYTQVVSVNVPAGGPAFELPPSLLPVGWTTLSGSNWIWDGNNQNAITVEFIKTFYLYCQVTEISVMVSADDFFYTKFNNQNPDCIASGNYGTILHCSLTSYAVQGFNKLSFIVTNTGGPAGLLYSIDILCQFDPTVDSGNCLCNTGYYWNNFTCENCYNTCLNCTGSGMNECNSCKSFSSLQADNTCKCNSHYHFNGTACYSCNSNCLDCAGPLSTDCISCESGYYLSGSSCLPCFSACFNCTGGLSTECIGCKTGLSQLSDGSCTCGDNFYWNSSSCNNCYAGCLECTGPGKNQCNSCIPALTLKTNACVCPSKTYWNSTACVSCYGKCSSCIGQSENECTACIPGLVLENSKTCECPDKTYWNSSACASCNEKCSGCTGPTENDCKGCSPGLMREKNTTCVCPSQTYWNSSTCIQCYQNCSECTGPTENECSACIPGLILENNSICVEKLPINLKFLSVNGGSNIYVITGTYSGYYSVTTDTGTLSTKLILNPTVPGLSIIPSSITLYSSLPSGLFKVGASIGTIGGIYNITWNITETPLIPGLYLYVNTFISQVQVNTFINRIPIKFTNPSSVPDSGISLPIILSCAPYYTYSNFTLSFTLDPNNTQITFSPSKLTYSSSVNSLAFQIINPSKLATITNYTIRVNITGPDGDLYSVPTIQISVGGTSNAVVLSELVLTPKTYNILNVSVKSTGPAVIYSILTTTYAYNLNPNFSTLSYIKKYAYPLAGNATERSQRSLAAQYTEYNYSISTAGTNASSYLSYTVELILISNNYSFIFMDCIPGGSNSYSTVIYNLLANTNYTMIIWADNLSGNTSRIKGTVATPSEFASILSLQFVDSPSNLLENIIIALTILTGQPLHLFSVLNTQSNSGILINIAAYPDLLNTKSTMKNSNSVQSSNLTSTLSNLNVLTGGVNVSIRPSTSDDFPYPQYYNYSFSYSGSSLLLFNFTSVGDGQIYNVIEFNPPWNYNITAANVLLGQGHNGSQLFLSQNFRVSRNKLISIPFNFTGYNFGTYCISALLCNNIGVCQSDTNLSVYCHQHIYAPINKNSDTFTVVLLASLIIPIISVGLIILIYIICRYYKKKRKTRETSDGSLNESSFYKDNSELKPELNNTSFPSRPHPFIIQNNEVDLEIIINPEESSEFFAKPGEIRINESNFEQFVPVQSLDSKRTCAGKSLCGLCKGQLNTEIETRLLPCGDAFHGQCIRKYMVEENNRICLVCNRNYS